MLATRLSRRTLLGASAAVGIGAVAGCQAGATDPNGGPDRKPDPSGSGNPVPAYVPFAGVTPDIPPANSNSIAGFLNFPANRPSVLERKPSLAEPVTILAQQSVFAPPPMDQNAFWKNLNNHFGVTFNLTMVPGSDYVSKFQALVASNDLPELVRVPQVPRLGELMKAKFADLSEVLGSDAVKSHPMLANIPTVSWKAAMFDGQLMGIPMHLLPIASRVEARTDILASLGVEAKFSNAAEFLDFCREVTDAKSQRFAMVSPTSNFTKQICGVPNQWKVDSGSFTHEIETDEYKRWLELSTTLWSEGLVHPDAYNNPQLALLFQGGQFMLFEVGGQGFTLAMPSYVKASPKLTVAPVVPPKYDGGGNAAVYTGTGANGFTAINKNVSPDRIAELLVLLDGLAAPFGTQEWLALQFGKEGDDYTWTDGSPTLTEAGAKEKVVMNYVPGSPMVMYSAGYPEVTKAECDFETAVGETAIPLPTVGLISDTAMSIGASLELKITNAVADVITGRKSLSAWDGVVADWRSSGGDKIRDEFERANAAR